MLSISKPKPVEGAPLPLVPQLMSRPSINAQTQTSISIKDFLQKVDIIDSNTKEKIILTNQQMEKMDGLVNGLYSRAYTYDQVILKLRGGDGLFDVVSLVVIGLILQILVNQVSPGTAFQTQPVIPLSLLPNGAPRATSAPGPRGTSPQIEMKKPSGRPQKHYSSLTKSQNRELKDPFGRDVSATRQGFPRLELRYNQVMHKTGKHGDLAGLPVNSKGKVEKTEKML